MRSPLHYSTLHHKVGAKRAGGGPLVVTTHVQLLGAFFAPHKLTRTYAPKADLGSSSEVVKRTSVCSGMAIEARRTAANEEKKNEIKLSLSITRSIIFALPPECQASLRAPTRQSG